MVLRPRRPVIAVLATAALLLLAACDTDADRANAFVAKGRSLYEAGRVVEARLELRSALDLQPDHAQALYLMALVSEREGAYPAVPEFLRRAVAADPRFAEARIKLGNYYALAGRVAAARGEADAALRLAPGTAGARLLSARVHHLEGDRARALDEARHARALDPRRQDVVAFMASVLAGAGDPAGALAAVDDAIGGAGPQAAEGLYRIRVLLLGQLGDLDAQARELERLRAAYPGVATYELALVRLEIARGRPAMAEALLRERVAAAPADVEWRARLAAFLAGAGRPADAEAVLRQGVAAYPASASMRRALGAYLEGSNRGEEAIALYRTVAEAEPRSPDGIAARLRIAGLGAARDAAGARRLVDAVLADVPGQPDALVLRATFNARDGRFDEAVADLRSAVARDPTSTRALLALARTQWRAGDLEAAAMAYRRLLDLDPGHAAVVELAALEAGRGVSAAGPGLADPGTEPAPGEPDAADAEARRLVAPAAGTR